MKKFLLAPFIAALVMFLWGYVYYGVSGFPYQTLQAPEDAGKNLDKIFPHSGVYIVPDPRLPPEEIKEKMAEGPFATVHIKKGGLPAMNPTVMGMGFALEFVSCALMVVLLGMTRIGGYANRVVFVVAAAILMTFFAHAGQAIWWYQDWAWHIRTMIHDVIGWGLAGLILAWFVKND